MEEPKVKRAFAFVDGQNLSLSAKSAFGCRYPAYENLARLTVGGAVVDVTGPVYETADVPPQSPLCLTALY